MITLKYEVAKEKYSLDSGGGFIEIEEKDIPELLDEVILVEQLNREDVFEMLGHRIFPKKRYIIEDNPVEDV